MHACLLRRGAFCALNRLFYFWNRNCLLCVIAETYTKIKQRFYCTYYYIGIPMWQLLSFQEQILIIWWVFWGYCFSNWTLLTENLFVWFIHEHIHTYTHTYIQPLFIHDINSKLQACGVVCENYVARIKGRDQASCRLTWVYGHFVPSQIVPQCRRERDVKRAFFLLAS